LDCHTEIAARLSARKGLHATYHIQPGSSQECAGCHSEHNGEDFPLIKWDIKSFDHKETGYLLEGQHAGLACNKCHNASRISPEGRASIKIKDPSRTYLGVATVCTTCHQDQHKGRLGMNCLMNRPDLLMAAAEMLINARRDLSEATHLLRRVPR
jgi:hypothetical protein